MIPVSRSLSRLAVGTASLQLLRLLVQLASLAVLARLVGPESYGLVAVVLIFVGFGEVLRDGGLSVASIAQKDLSRTQQSNLMWVSVGLGLVLGVILAGSAGLVADTFGDPRIADICLTMAIVFLINSVAAQYRADLARRFKLVSVSVVELAAQVVGLGVGVSAAVAGGGLWSIVAQQLTIASVTTIGLVFLSPFRPSRPRRDGTTRPLLTFGSLYLATQFFVYAGQNAGMFLVGLRVGAVELGLLNRANQLVAMPISQLTGPATNLALPALNERIERREALLRTATILLAYPVMIVTVVSIASSDLLVLVALGPAWADAAPILAVLVVAAFFQCVNLPTFWTFLAAGRPDENLRFACVTRTAAIVALAIASSGGLMAVVSTMAGVSAATVFAGDFWVRSRLGLPGFGLSATVGRVVAIGAFASAVSWVISDAANLPGQSPWRLIISIGAATAVLAAASMVPAVRKDLAQLQSTVRKLRMR